MAVREQSAGSAGYSGAPQARKLGLQRGLRVDLHRAPDSWALYEPPDGLLQARAPEPADVILASFNEPADLDEELPELSRRGLPGRRDLVAVAPVRRGVPRREMTENAVRNAALPLGLVDVKVAAVEATGPGCSWSGGGSFALPAGMSGVQHRDACDALWEMASEERVAAAVTHQASGLDLRVLLQRCAHGRVRVRPSR